MGFKAEVKKEGDKISYLEEKINRKSSVKKAES